MIKKNYYFNRVIDLSINKYLLIYKEYYMFIAQYSCMIYESKNNRYGKKLVH